MKGEPARSQLAEKLDKTPFDYFDCSESSPWWLTGGGTMLERLARNASECGGKINRTVLILIPICRFR